MEPHELDRAARSVRVSHRLTPTNTEYPQELRINSKCGDRIYRGSCATGNRHGGHGEQELPTVESRCRFG